MKNLLRLHAILISLLLDDSDSDSDSGDSNSDSGDSGNSALSSAESVDYSNSDSNSSGQQQPTETSNQRPPLRPEDLNPGDLGNIPPQWDPNNLPEVPPSDNIQPPGDWPGPKS